MIEVEAKLRRWGRSFGVVVPMDVVRKERLVEDEDVRILISKKKKNPFAKHFGSFKFKRPIQEILDEGDRESWDE